LIWATTTGTITTLSKFADGLGRVFTISTPARVTDKLKLASVCAPLNGLAQTGNRKKRSRHTELANAIVFIASDEASFITGHVLNVDGVTALTDPVRARRFGRLIILVRARQLDGFNDPDSAISGCLSVADFCFFDAVASLELSAPYYKIEIARQPTNAEPEMSNRRRDRLVVACRNAAKML
jgi:hypothetical protein